jgi:hypothetical protein
MCQKPATCVHALANARNQELTFGRFLDHSSVSYGEMLTVRGWLTGHRAARPGMLASLDTTEFSFPVTPPASTAFGGLAMTATKPVVASDHETVQNLGELRSDGATEANPSYSRRQRGAVIVLCQNHHAHAATPDSTFKPSKFLNP